MLARPLAVLALAATPALAQEAPAAPSPEVRALFEAMEIPGLVDVMAAEGEAYGEELAAGLFAGAVPQAWSDRVAAIYDADRMEETVLAAFADGLEGADLGAMAAFFEAEPGATFADLELAAREALLDDDVEQAAKEAAAVAAADADPRMELLRRYVEANEIIDTNVAGALNTNVAYVMGLMDGGATEDGLSETDVLADVQSQEPRIRADTTEWVYSFLLMAYAPASDDDLEALIAFSETEAGQDLNRAVYRAFDGAFVDISRELGFASARYMTTEEL